MRLSIEQLVTTPATLNYLTESAYDYTKWNVGKGLIYNAGGSTTTNYIAPIFDAIRPMEESTAFSIVYAVPINVGNLTYLFGIENNTGATSTRRVAMWTINRKTGARSWNGYITLTLASATAHTCRSFAVDYKTEATGTVAVSTTAVTGTSTVFTTNKVAVGARIGFGSTNPANITTWYRVSAVGSDTSITLGSSAPTLAGGTPYVIQEFRPVYLTTNATTTNGGIHYAKGVTPEDFTGSGTTIAAAVSTDDQKAVYWIKDASTQTNLVASGMTWDTATRNATTLTTYVLDLTSAGNYKVYVYNLRTALTVATGASVSSFVLATGLQPFTGTGVQNDSLTLATTAHGTGNGVKSLYFISTTRVMRAAVSGVTSGSTTWKTDEIAEIPPGGVNTYAASGVLSTICYMSNLDIFVYGTTHTAGIFSYVSQYVTSGSQFQKIFGRDFKYLEQSTKDNNAPTFFSNQATVCSYSDDDENTIYICKQGTTQQTNHIFISAFGADWTYAANASGRLISPSIPIANVSKFYRLFVNHFSYMGDLNLGKSAEEYRMYARTANITTDATSGWVLIDSSNDLSGFAGASAIQIAIEFKTIGDTMLPSRILGVNVEYEDITTDSHYAVAIGKSSLSAKQFAFKFQTAFGGTVPALTITLSDSTTAGVLVTDTTNSPTGTWEKTTDGTTWTAYNTTDKTNNTTWIRYTPTSLADNIQVSAYLKQS